MVSPDLGLASSSCVKQVNRSRQQPAEAGQAGSVRVHLIHQPTDPVTPQRRPPGLEPSRLDQSPLKSEAPLRLEASSLQTRQDLSSVLWILVDEACRPGRLLAASDEVSAPNRAVPVGVAAAGLTWVFGWVSGVNQLALKSNARPIQRSPNPRASRSRIWAFSFK